MNNKRLLLIVSIVGILLLIPLIAMQFTSEVNWNILDFIVAASLLLGTGLICNLLFTKVSKPIAHMVLCAMVLSIICLMWAELAVGIF